jgi:hypothetical protein
MWSVRFLHLYNQGLLAVEQGDFLHLGGGGLLPVDKSVCSMGTIGGLLSEDKITWLHSDSECLLHVEKRI